VWKKKRSDDTRKNMSDAPSTSQEIEVFDLRSVFFLFTSEQNKKPAEKTTTSYNSINETARALNIHKSVIDKYFSRNQTKPYKGKYTFNKIDS